MWTALQFHSSLQRTCKTATSSPFLSIVFITSLLVCKSVHGLSVPTLVVRGGAFSRPATNLFARRPKGDDIDDLRHCVDRVFSVVCGDWRQVRAKLVLGEQQNPESRAFEDLSSFAHPLDNVEDGCLLLANEKLGGRLFRAVYFVTSHDERRGTRAIGVSRLLPGDIHSLVDTDADATPAYVKYPSFSSVLVVYGGRTTSFYGNEQSVLTALHNNALIRGSWQVVPGLHIGGTARDLDKAIRRSSSVAHPSLACTNVVLAKGYTSFAPSQLEREVRNGVWYLAAASPHFVLHHALKKSSDSSSPPDEMWYTIMMSMGGKYADIARASREQEAAKDSA